MSFFERKLFKKYKGSGWKFHRHFFNFLEVIYILDVLFVKRTSVRMKNIEISLGEFVLFVIMILSFKRDPCVIGILIRCIVKIIQHDPGQGKIKDIDLKILV